MEDITMMNTATNAANIHCKLTFNNQIRRFVFTGTEFTDLCGQISPLIALPPDGFVLKYVDNESDLITLSTNEELALALEISDKVLRLIAEPVSQAGTTPVSTQADTWAHFSHWRGGGRGRRGGHHGYGGGHFSGHHGPHGGYFGGHHGDAGPHSPHGGPPGGTPGGPHGGTPGGHHGGHHGHGGHYSGHHGGDQFEKWEEQKTRLTSKIEMMKNLLAQMPPDEQSPRKYKLMAQIHRLEGRLIRWDTWIDKKGKKAEQKRCRKFEKHEKKHEKKFDHLSPEALQQLQLYKAQIASLKPTLYELKSAKKAKKAQLQVALQQGSGDKEAIWQEILVLKERITEVKKEIKPLKEGISALKEKK
jgi:hypothetical protein